MKMASALQFCRICLSVNVKMFTFKNTNIEHLYQLLTQVYVDKDDGIPAIVCFLCHARLQQCRRLQQQAVKSNKLLEQLSRRGLMQATANAILNNPCNSQDLQVSTMYHLDLEPTTCEDVLLEPSVESDSLVSVKEETEAIDEERKNIHLILDFSEDGYDPYGFFPEAIHSTSKEEKQITAISSKHCDGIKDVGHGLEQRIKQDQDFRDDAYDPCDIVPKAEFSDSEDDQPLTSIVFKFSEIQDTTHALERSKDQEKEYEYKVQSEKEIKSDPLPNCSNRRVDIIETEVNINSSLPEMYTCSNCTFKTYNKHSIETHLKIHTDSKVFSCDISEYKCPRKWNLKNNTAKKPFACNICEYRCTTKFDLNKHMNTHTGEKPFPCNICEHRCARKDDLIRHMRTHTGEKPFSCNICEYRFIRKCDLKTHMRTHTGEKPFSCNLCDYKCAKSSNLKHHMGIHTGEKPFSCNICGHKFTQKYTLKEHMRTHTGEIPFSCNICEYKCKVKAYLKRHITSHTGEKPFACNICEYKCATKYNLKHHMRTHTGEKPFSCNICEFKCTQKYNLKDHMRTHTEEKPFSCNICEYRCKAKSSLKRHLRTHK